MRLLGEHEGGLIIEEYPAAVRGPVRKRVGVFPDEFALGSVEEDQGGSGGGLDWNGDAGGDRLRFVLGDTAQACA